MKTLVAWSCAALCMVLAGCSDPAPTQPAPMVGVAPVASPAPYAAAPAGGGVAGQVPAPAPAPVPTPAPPVARTPESCNITSFTQQKNITACIYDPPRGMYDFAYNEGRFALAVASESAWGSMLDVSVLDKDGGRLATHTTVGNRMEFDPNVVGAPWGGFYVAYKFSDGGGGDVRIAGRTLGYDGKWSAPGILATTRSAAYGIRLRRLADKIGIWFKEYGNGDKEVAKYLEVIDNQEVRKPVPADDIPPLANKAWASKVKDDPRWPLAQKKALRVLWADDRFGVIVRKRTGGGEQAEFYYFAAMCE